MHADAEDCGTWHENSDWHSDGNLDVKETVGSRKECEDACNAHTEYPGCNAGTPPPCACSRSAPGSPPFKVQLLYDMYCGVTMSVSALGLEV